MNPFEFAAGDRPVVVLDGEVGLTECLEYSPVELNQAGFVKPERQAALDVGEGRIAPAAE